MRFALLLLVALIGFVPVAHGLDLTGVSLARLGREYKRLRQRRPDDADRFGSRYHELMRELGKRLGSGRYTCGEVQRHMGQPDHREEPGSNRFSLARPPGGTTRLLVYEWRGGHDWLWFACEGRRATKADWWMAFD